MSRRTLSAVIWLLWIFLAAFSIIKIFFGEAFAVLVENERIIQIGSYLDTHLMARLLIDILIGILTMHLYLGACLQQWKLKVFQYLIIIGYSVGIVLCKLWSPTVTVVIDISVPIILPLLFKGKFSQTAIIYLLHHLAQLIVLFIRSEPLYLVSTNYATQFLLIFDVYVWLTIYYLYSNLYKEKTLWESLLLCFSEIRRKKSLKKNSRKPKTR